MSCNPSEELVEVIDDAGRTIATVRRKEIRARRLPHRCVYLFVFNQGGDLFIHQRTPSKDVYPGYWDVCIGGVLAAGESFQEGACREAMEELGAVVDPEPLFPFRYADAATIVQAMVYRVVHDGPFQLQPEEIVSGAFVTLGELKGRIAQAPFCPDGLAALAEYDRRGHG